MKANKAKAKNKKQMHPFEKLFNEWFQREGCRFYSTKGHEDYMRFAFISGMFHGANAVIKMNGQSNDPDSKQVS